MKKHPNPQGKGLIPVLESILVSRIDNEIPAKNIEQVICELFTSQFVLQGKFSFCPVILRSYWLYRKNDSFRLSMVAPQEWGNDHFGQFIAECVMQADMTWTLALSEDAINDKNFTQDIDSQWQKFNKKLTSPALLKRSLPVYDAKLPFYQRVLASNLAYSLGISLNKSLTGHEQSERKLIESKNNIILTPFAVKEQVFRD